MPVSSTSVRDHRQSSSLGWGKSDRLTAVVSNQIDKVLYRRPVPDAGRLVLGPGITETLMDTEATDLLQRVH
jgi:hypothetical protein